ncbi:hypothetical protein [Duganella sp. Root1480D1]|uniref:hypothetical protein n=1 Tax=Duganella sp. Root1480D1 TaxID=1736471 RepID=UPI000A77191F|nr:hypothetical protein [Duganella sp. Root1480D1]
MRNLTFLVCCSPLQAVPVRLRLLNAAEKDYTPARIDLATIEKLLTPEEEARGRTLASTLVMKSDYRHERHQKAKP